MTDTTISPSASPALLRRPLFRALLLFAVVVLPFLPAVTGGYIWDDDFWLVDNAAVHAWNGLVAIWNPWRQTLHFYPITFTTLWLEHKLWALNPLGYHIANMLFHAIGAIGLYLCLKRLGLRAAWLGAVLWAVHPVQVESVAWVAEIKNVLSGIFFFFSAFCYLQFALPPVPDVADTADSSATTSPAHKMTYYALSLFLFILALLTKTVTVVLPALLLILLWARGRQIRRALTPLIPFFIVGLACAAFTAGQERRVMEIGGGDNFHFTLLERLIICGKDVWFYLRTLLVPYPLMEVYPRWSYQPGDLLNYLPILGVLVLAIALFALRHRISRWPFAAFACFVAALSPALGFINFFTMHYTFVADHYQYLGSVCVLVFAAELFARATRSSRTFIIGSTTVLVLLMAATAFYASLFQTSIRLWSWNVQHNPDAFAAQHNLGAALIRSGDAAEGRRRIFLALSQQPDDDNIQRSAGQVALTEGRLEDAIDHFQKAIRLRPDFGRSYLMLGATYERLGRLDDALANYRKAMELSPGEPGGSLAFAALLKKQNKFEEAAKAYEDGLYYDPGNMIARYNYANTLLDLHRYPDAIAAYQLILKYQPDNPAVWDNLAYAYHELGQNDKALDARQHALQLQPRTPATAP